MNDIKILAFAGSLRKDSYNRKLLKLAVETIREQAHITVFDLKENPFPLYDGDLEASEGIPENAKQFMQLMEESDGFLIASPEYNSSFSGVLKNAIDWASRPVEGKKSLYCFRDKVVVLIGASTGYYGTARGLMDLRKMLSNIHALVLPNQVTIPNAETSFDENGNLVENRHIKALKKTTEKLVETISKLKG